MNILRMLRGTDNVRFVCPFCRASLVLKDNMLCCGKCTRNYPVHNGIPCFEPQDDFYEGKFTHTHSLIEERFDKKLRFVPIIFRRMLMRLWLFFDLSQRRERFFRRLLPRFLKGSSSVILDVGCGGGNKLFARFGSVVGVDLSLSSLIEARGIYRSVAQGQLCRLPFPCMTFDCIISSDLIGHIPNEEKNVVFREFYRVLKPGGVMLHIAETDSNSLWFNITPQKRLEEEKWGHHGLEMPSALLTRLRETGFTQKYARKIWGSIRPLGEFASYLVGIPGLPMIIRLMTRFDKMASRLPYGLKRIINCLLGLIYGFIEPLQPLDKGEGLLMIHRKPFI